MPLSTEEQNLYVAIWSKAIDTQMHFNEMSVKSRQFGLGFVAAALGIGIVFLIRGEQFSLPVHIWGGFDVNGMVLILLASAFALTKRLIDMVPSRDFVQLPYNNLPSSCHKTVIRPGDLSSLTHVN